MDRRDFLKACSTVAIASMLDPFVCIFKSALRTGGNVQSIQKGLACKGGRFSPKGGRP